MSQDNFKYRFVFKRSSRSFFPVRRLNFSQRFAQILSGFFVLIFVLISTFNTTDSTNIFKVQHLFQIPDASPQTRTALIRAKEFSIIATAPHIYGEGGPENNEIQIESAAEAALSDVSIFADESSSIPSIYPLNGKINNGFGWRNNPFGGAASEYHPGLDIDGERGDAVVATAGGTVIKAGWQGGYGNLIEIDHGNGITTRYGHLSSIEVQNDQIIERGQEIGKVGSTGRSTGPHLHYEVRLKNSAVNPRRYLPPQ